MRTHRRRARLCLAAAAGVSAVVSAPQFVRAQQNTSDPTVLLNASDSGSTSSFAGGPVYNWAASSDASLPAGSAPMSGYAYVVTGSATGTGVLRTPASGSATFAGDSLTIVPYNAQANLFNSTTSIVNAVDTTAGLFISGNVAGQTITVNNLVLANGGAVLNQGYNAGTTSATATSSILNGSITLLPAGSSVDGINTTMSGGIIDSYAGPSGQNNQLVVNATLNGSGLLHILSSGGTNGSVVALNSSNPSFSGGVLLDNNAATGSGNQPYLLINTPTALGTGPFTIGNQLAATGTNESSSAGPTIDNASGAAETLTTNNAMVWNGSFQYQGNAPKTAAVDSLNLGSGGATIGASIAIGVYGHGVLSEMGNIVQTSSFGSGTSFTLTINDGGTFEVPAPSNLQVTRTNVSSGTTLAFLATNTSSAQFITALTNSAAYAFNFASGSSIGIDTTGYSGTFVFSGALPVTAIGLNKLGAGTVQLATSNAYTGATNVSAGTLKLGSATGIASTTGVYIQPGATLDLNGFSPNTLALLNGSGSVINNGGNAATLNITTGASSTSSSSAAIYSGNISNGTSAVGLTLNLTSATNNFNISGATDTYTGGTLLTKGVLIVGANSIPASSNVAFNGGVLAFAAQPASTFTMNAGTGSSYNFNAGAGVTAFLAGGLGNSTSAASVNMSGPGVVIIGGTNTYTGSTNIASGSTFGFTSPSAFPPSISGTNSIALPTANSSFGIGNSTGNNFTLTMGISGAGGLNKVGTNTVTLTGTGYTYTGVTNVSGGTLILGAANVIPTSASTNLVSVGAAGTLDLGGFNLSVPNLIGAGVVTNSTMTPVSLTIATGTSTVGAGWSGNISDGASTTSLVVNPSAGVFNMSGSTNSYTGGTNLASGTLVVGAASLPATGKVVFNGGALDFTAPLTVDPSANFVAGVGNTLNFNDSNGTTVVLTGNIGDSGSGPTGITMTGTGTVILAGTDTFTGPITINGGTLGFGSPSSLPSGVTLSGSGYLGVGNSTGNNFNFSTPVGGSMSLNKVGTNTVYVTGNNTYTGQTLVSNGTLVLASPTALGNTSGLNMGSNSAAPNGTLDLNGYSITLPALSGGAYGGVITNTNASASVLTLQGMTSSSYYGAITGNTSVVINFPDPNTSSVAMTFGAGTNNVMTYTGTTNLASGMLSLGGAGLLPTAAHNIQFNGGYLELAGNSQTTASAMDFSAGFSTAPNQQFNIIAGPNTFTYTFNSSLNSAGGSLTLGNYNIGGAGTLVLAAPNYYSGLTTVNTGVLQVTNPQALLNTSGIVVNSSTGTAIGALPTDGTLQVSDTSGQAGLNASGQPVLMTLNGLGPWGYIKWSHFSGGRPVSTVEGYSFTGGLQGSAPNGSAGTAAQPDVWAGNIAIGSGFNINGTNYVGISGGFNDTAGSNTTSGGVLKLTGSISGTGNVVVGLNSYSTTILAGSNTYVGETQITSILGLPTTLQLGANNAIPSTSGLNFANDNAVQAAAPGSTFNYSAATFDLNGYSTSTAYVTSSTSLINTTSTATTVNTNGVVTNNRAGTTSTLTVLGNPSSGPFLGTYQDGTGILSLDFNGVGQVFSMTGTNNYSGGTTIDAGTLVASNLGAIGTTLAGGGNITVNANAILQQTSPGAIFTKLQTGFANGNWNGSGINSTIAASDSTHLTAVGMLTPTSSTSFEGQSLNVGDVALKLTYYGDATLDGQVNSADYTLIDNAFLNNSNSANTALTGWQNGDFNYDGVINGSDYTLIDNAFNMQGAQINAEIASPTAQIGSGTTSAVPEPTSLALIGLCVAGLLGRRRRH